MSQNSDVLSMVNRAIGARVAWYMKYVGDTRRTQAELAELLGIEQSAVSKKLTGRRPFFPHELYAIAAWLDRPLSDFLPIGEAMVTAPDDDPNPETRARTDGRASTEIVRPIHRRRRDDSTGDTHQYVSQRDYVLSQNVTDESRYARVA